MVFRREGNSRSSGQLLAVALIFSLPGCGSSTDLPGIQRPISSNDDLEDRDSLESIIGTFLDTHAAHTVTLGSHELISGTFRFAARQAGQSTLTVYFPTVVTGFASIRLTRAVVVS